MQHDHTRAAGGAAAAALTDAAGGGAGSGPPQSRLREAPGGAILALAELPLGGQPASKRAKGDAAVLSELLCASRAAGGVDAMGGEEWSVALPPPQSSATQRGLGEVGMVPAAAVKGGKAAGAEEGLRPAAQQHTGPPAPEGTANHTVGGDALLTQVGCRWALMKSRVRHVPPANVTDLLMVGAGVAATPGIAGQDPHAAGACPPR